MIIAPSFSADAEDHKLCVSEINDVFESGYKSTWRRVGNKLFSIKIV